MSVRQRRPTNGTATQRDMPSADKKAKPSSAEGGLAIVTASYIILVRHRMRRCRAVSRTDWLPWLCHSGL
jgi:hypothetical protein